MIRKRSNRTVLLFVLASLASPPLAFGAPEAGAGGVDREELVRFARSIGMMSQDLPIDRFWEDEAPWADGLDQAEQALVESRLDENGLEEATFERLLERMRTDERFRQRVRSLARPYSFSP